jgi:hypothetical protein
MEVRIFVLHQVHSQLVDIQLKSLPSYNLPITPLPSANMHFPKIAESLALLILCSTAVIAAPIPQGAGVGDGCDG